MRLRLYSDDDLALTEAMECDPAVMAELGGPVPRAEIPALHRRRLEFTADDPCEPRFEQVHAFPGVTNAASNALCRKFGFALLGEIDGDYRGATLRCNHWVLALRGADQAGTGGRRA